MCGIAGFVGAGTLSDLQRMTDALRHRGPDGEGHYQAPDQQLFLGHRRLAILDLAGGAQPMWDAAREHCVIFNGEIYNHAILRQELIACGERFESHHSDTEVLLCGYRAWGLELLLRRLNGMYAFVLYDQRNHQLLLVRDRLGEKPLFWGQVGETFCFASELPAIRCHPDLQSAALEPLALQKFCAHNFFRHLGHPTAISGNYLPASGCVTIFPVAVLPRALIGFFTLNPKPAP